MADHLRGVCGEWAGGTVMAAGIVGQDLTLEKQIADAGIAASGRAAADAVNPSHYASHAIQPTDLIDEYDLNFYCGNVVKYVCRHKEKNGREDLKKALWYLLYELGVPREEIREFTRGLN